MSQVGEYKQGLELTDDVAPHVRELLATWSRCEPERPVVGSIPERFINQAANIPTVVAVVHGERRITFAELASAADNVARGLQKRGVRHGDLVGTFCERSPELVAMILGIWKCGGVYLPLDPKYPSQRLKSILEDASPKLIVSDRQLTRQITPSSQAATTIAEFHMFDQLSPSPKSRANKMATSSCGSSHAITDRAVVLYTSGSTGTPKGVVLTHRNLANHNAFMIRMLNLQVGDRRPALASINFDVSLEEHFCTLNAGATLVLPTSNTLDSMATLLKFIETERLSGFFVTTSLWRELTNYLHETHGEFPSTIKTLMVGGEQASLAVYRRFLEVGGRRIRWINVYGPTETAIYSSTYEHGPEPDTDSTEPPPIGRPIDNTLLFVCDEKGDLVAPGATGELYIGGLGVAEGYLGRDDLTRQRFVTNPSPHIPPGRYYRTGDQVRFRADGQLEYVGRIDNQVKLRGFRIEPGEIEATLLQHPTVRDAVVVVATSPTGSRYLAAYIVLRPGASWSVKALQSFARDRLPDYMVPQALLQLDALPLSPNGKIDRKALPEPLHFEPQNEDRLTTDKSATTVMEQRVLDVWREAFGCDSLGLADDFFALGGDSLKAMSLTARLESTIGRHVTPSLLFECRTAGHLAAILEDGPDQIRRSPILLREGDLTRPLFFLHSLAGDVWIYRETVAALRGTQAVFGIQLPQLADELPDCNVDEVTTCASQYVEMLRAVQPCGPYRLAGYSSGAWMAYEIARQLEAKSERVEFLGLLDAGVPLTLERRLTVSRLHQARALQRNLPLFLRELVAMRSIERRRAFVRYFRCIASSIRGLLGLSDRRRASKTSAKCDMDQAFMSHFAEDISFFSPSRLLLIKNHFQAVERYQAGPLRGGAQLFRVARQPMSSVPTKLLGWEHLIGGLVRVRVVAGTHATLMHGTQAIGLAAAIDDELDLLSTTDLPQLRAGERADP